MKVVDLSVPYASRLATCLFFFITFLLSHSKADLFPKFEELKKAPIDSQVRFHSKIGAVLVEIEESARRNDQFTYLEVGMTSAQAQDVLVDSKIEACGETDSVCLISGYSGCTKKGRCRPPARASCGFRQVNCSSLMGQRPTGGLWCIGQQDSQRHRNLASLCLQAHPRAVLSDDLKESYRKAVGEFERFWPKFCSNAMGGSARSLDCSKWRSALMGASAELRATIPPPVEIHQSKPAAKASTETTKKTDSKKNTSGGLASAATGKAKSPVDTSANLRDAAFKVSSDTATGANPSPEKTLTADQAETNASPLRSQEFKNLEDGWIKTPKETELCVNRAKIEVQSGLHAVCLKSCGERDLTLLIKQEGENKKLSVLLANSEGLMDLANLDLEPLSALSCELNATGLEWFEKTIVRYLREALRCDQVLGRVESPDELNSPLQKKSLSCPNTQPPRSYSVVWQPEGVRDPRNQVRSYPRLLFDDSRGYRVDCWSSSPLNMTRLANDLFVHRLSRCPKGSAP